MSGVPDRATWALSGKPKVVAVGWGLLLVPTALFVGVGSAAGVKLGTEGRVVILWIAALVGLLSGFWDLASRMRGKPPLGPLGLCVSTTALMVGSMAAAGDLLQGGNSDLMPLILVAGIPAILVLVIAMLR